jgi:putative FmdB family regulatory protein
MASYLYRCGACGPWEVHRPIGTAEPMSTCPACGALGRRRYTPPLLSRTPTAEASARLREEASGDDPRGDHGRAARGRPAGRPRPAVECPAASLTGPDVSAPEEGVMATRTTDGPARHRPTARPTAAAGCRPRPAPHGPPPAG